MARQETICRDRLQGNDYAALGVALQHPAISTSQQILKRIPMICRAWRAAAQQASSRALDVQFELWNERPANDDEDDIPWPPAGILQLAGFGSWLTKYAGLVHSITINSSGASWLLFTSLQPLCKHLAGPMLVHSLQAATRQPFTAVQPQQLLRLHSYTSNMLHSSAVLHALSGAGVVCLNLMHCSVASITAALPLLSSLQSLQLEWYQVTDVGELMPVIGQHSGLTHLTLSQIGAFHPLQLPVQLQQLQVHSVTESRQGIPGNLGHLTCLTRLVLKYEGRQSATHARLYEGIVLPTQLQELQVHSPTYHPGESAVRDLNITALQHLTKLTLKKSQESPNALLDLRNLPNLQQLALSYTLDLCEDDQFAPVCDVWPQLQQLQGIKVSGGHYGGLSASTFRAMLHNLTAVTGLTQLKLSIKVYPDEQEEYQAEPQNFGFCNQIAAMQKLRELTLWCSTAGDLKFVSGDVHHLSALTSLTKLCLGGPGEHISDVAVSAIALMLTGLQWLRTHVSSDAVLPVIGRLTGLRHLHVYGLSGSEHLQAHFLDQLQHLTHQRFH